MNGRVPKPNPELRTVMYRGWITQKHLITHARTGYCQKYGITIFAERDEDLKAMIDAWLAKN